MKFDAVNGWLRHWLRLQSKGKNPLVLIDGSNKSLTTYGTMASTLSITATQCKGKKKAGYIDPDVSDTADKADSKNDRVLNASNPVGNSADDPASTPGPDEPPCVPQPPSSASSTRKSRLTYLMSLSDNPHYRKLIVLLRAAKVGALLFGVPVAEFFARMGTSQRDHHPHGHLGHLMPTTCLRPFTTQLPLPPFHPLRNGF